MESNATEQAVLTELSELMERTGFHSIGSVMLPTVKNDAGSLEVALSNLKTLNAKYDKNEAIQQIRCLMDKYNIQLDQLMDQRGLI